MSGLDARCVVCTSEGGVYDDDAFWAGVQYGAIIQLIKFGAATGKQTPVGEWTIIADLVPQIDLLAMEHDLIIVAKEHPTRTDMSIIEFKRATQ